ncbi:MAG: hypothetical protein WDN28_28395 [Chthoniobacter sp.]
MRRSPFPFSIFHLPSSAALLPLLITAFLLSASFLRAQTEEAPPPQRSGMRITFLPPPMEGTLSLGIYDKKGKLLRTMAREATEKDFTVGLNGLITFWDGKDDSGKVMPPGIYAARGYSVGAIDVDGIALHGNDWITDDDAPRPARVVDLRPAADDKVDVILRTLDGKETTRTLSFDTQPHPPAEGTVSIHDGKVKLSLGGRSRDFPLGADETAVDAALGAPDRLWVIVRAATAPKYAPTLFMASFSAASPTRQRSRAAPHRRCPRIFRRALERTNPPAGAKREGAARALPRPPAKAGRRRRPLRGRRWSRNRSGSATPLKPSATPCTGRAANPSSPTRSSSSISSTTRCSRANRPPPTSRSASTKAAASSRPPTACRSAASPKRPA